MSSSRRSIETADWEKVNAPRVTRRRLVIAVVVYSLWIIFLAVLAADRWLGSLQ